MPAARAAPVQAYSAACNHYYPLISLQDPNMPFDLDIRKILSPSLGVEIVFDLNSLTPQVSSSIIYDVDHLKQTVITAQPRIPINPDFVARTIHLTTLVTVKGSKKRVGIKCRPIEFNNDYRLSNNRRVGAIIFKYDPPMTETTIRSAYRLPVGKRHGIRMKLIHGENNYYSTRDFSIRDISLTGITLVIPRNIKDRQNPLERIGLNVLLPLGIIINKDPETPATIIPAIIKIMRLQSTPTGSYRVAGARFERFGNPSCEEELNRFIHREQFEDLKRLSGI